MLRSGVVGLVVRAEDDYAILLARKAHDEVAHVHRTDGRVGGEGVFFELIVFEVSAQELLGLGVPWTGRPARTDRRQSPRV